MKHCKIFCINKVNIIAEMFPNFNNKFITDKQSINDFHLYILQHLFKRNFVKKEKVFHEMVNDTILKIL